MNFPLEQEQAEEADGEGDQLGPACTERGSSQVKRMGTMTRTEIGLPDCKTVRTLLLTSHHNETSGMSYLPLSQHCGRGLYYYSTEIRTREEGTSYIERFLQRLFWF